MEFIDVIKKREATRSFKDVRVDMDTLNKILEAGRLAPTAKNIQPQIILVADSDEALKKVDEVSPCRYNAPTVLIVCVNKDLVWSNGKESTVDVDASIIATHMSLAATNYGVDNVLVKMFDKEKLISTFNLDSNIEPVILLPIGYKTDDYQGNPLHLSRKPLEETVKFI